MTRHSLVTIACASSALLFISACSSHSSTSAATGVAATDSADSGSLDAEISSGKKNSLAGKLWLAIGLKNVGGFFGEDENPEDALPDTGTWTTISKKKDSISCKTTSKDNYKCDLTAPSASKTGKREYTLDWDDSKSLAGQLYSAISTYYVENPDPSVDPLKDSHLELDGNDDGVAACDTKGDGDNAQYSCVITLPKN
jgi:hypothetical protein